MKDVTGQRFGRLLALRYVGLSTKGLATWECRCDCGRMAIIVGAHMRAGITRSCGCLQDEARRTSTLSHGHKRGGRASKEYVAWTSMLGRCYHKDNISYKYYGARGVTVCSAWRQSFAAFLSDVGLAPEKSMTLDRENNDGNYEPGNVRWATRIQQNNNRRPAVHGPQGEAHGMAKLTNAAVRTIRASSLPRAVLAARFGVKDDTVGSIQRGDTWRHVT